MITNASVAQAFANGEAAKSGNARTDGTTYWLHGHAIATKAPDGLRYDWCCWTTPTTATHLNHIAQACGFTKIRFSYAEARDYGPPAGRFADELLAMADKEIRKAHRALHRGVS
jgi:hypothetical protein